MIDIDAPLSPIGYRAAFVLHIRKHWPSVSGKDADMLCQADQDVEIGPPDYVWTIHNGGPCPIPNAKAGEYAVRWTSTTGEKPLEYAPTCD